MKIEKTAVNVIDAAAQGAGDGLHLASISARMLIAFLALIAMCNGDPGLDPHTAADGLAAVVAGTGFRHSLRAGGVAARRAVERLRIDRQICWARAWC